MRRGAGVALLVLLLGACAPYAARPVGGGTGVACDYVRAGVADGTFPIDLAERWYSHCGPFEVVP